jgi:hypothetical protein
MEKLDLVGRFQKEKMRKLFVDHLAWLADEQFLPTVARYVARANLNPDNQPVLVSISKNWARMPPPDEQHWVAREQWPAHGFHDTLCTYKVKEKDLP